MKISLCHPALSISEVPESFFPGISVFAQVIVVEPSALSCIVAPSATNAARETSVNLNRLSITSVTVAVTDTGMLFVMLSNKPFKLLTLSAVMYFSSDEATPFM